MTDSECLRKLPAVRSFHHGGKSYLRRESDGYFNATLMCANNGKRWGNYKQLDTTKAFIAELEGSTGIPADRLIQEITTGLNHLRGTWVHPRVAVDLAQWISPAFKVAVNGWVTDKLLGKDPRLSDLRGASIEKRKAHVDVLIAHGCISDQSRNDIGYVTNQGYLGYGKPKAAEWKKQLGLSPSANLRDNIPSEDIAGIYVYEDIAASNIEAKDLHGRHECGDETYNAAHNLRRFIQSQKVPTKKTG